VNNGTFIGDTARFSKPQERWMIAKSHAMAKMGVVFKRRGLGIPIQKGLLGGNPLTGQEGLFTHSEVL
jgi:hypothetical protein